MGIIAPCPPADFGVQPGKVIAIWCQNFLRALNPKPRKVPLGQVCRKQMTNSNSRREMFPVSLWHVCKAGVTGLWSNRSWRLETAAGTNTFLLLDHGVLQAESGMRLCLGQKPGAVSLNSICVWQVLKAVFLFQRTQHPGACLLARASNWALQSSFHSSLIVWWVSFSRTIGSDIYSASWSLIGWA